MQKKESLYTWAICSLGALFYFYEFCLRAAPGVMTHELMGAFGISASTLGNLVGFYYYAYTPMQLPVGIMMDRYGPRRLLTLAAMICAIGTYLFASPFLLIAHIGRFLVGFGSAFAFVGVLKLATIWLPPQRFALIAGITTTLGMLGGLFGDLLLTPIVKSIGWRDTLYYSAYVGVGLAILLWLFIPSNHEQKNSSAITYKQLFTNVLFLIKKPQMWLIGLAGLTLYSSVTAFAELWGISYLKNVYDLSNLAAAKIVSSIFLGWAIGSPLLGWLSDRLQLRRMPMLICAILAFIIIVIILYFPNLARHNLFIWLFAFGVFTSIEVLVFPLARELNPSQISGTALAMTNMLVMTSGLIYQPLIGILLDLISNQKIKPITTSLVHFSKHDFQLTLAILPISIFIGIILILFIKETHAKTLSD